MMAVRIALVLSSLALPISALGDDGGSKPEQTSAHFQATTALQAHPKFAAKYSGTNSMPPNAEAAIAFVTTLFLDSRLWKGGEFIFDPEMSGGNGLGKTLGVAAFPSGIVYRVGDPAPALYVARILFRQSFGLGGGTVVDDTGPNQLRGPRDRDRLTLSLGRFSLTDVFDGNSLAHDATSQFFDWALFASGAWDYPADTRGYTWGLAADLSVAWWSLRTAIALQPVSSNAHDLDTRIDKAHGLMAEGEARYAIGGKKGATRLLLFSNLARMGSYAQVLANPAKFHNDVTATRADGRTKFGAALSADQEITSELRAFVRASVDDGANETWAFTEIDRTIAAGLVMNGAPWHRAKDEVGAAFVVNGLSDLHRRYLEGGGYGFIIGDGALNYGAEVEGDFYYRGSITDQIDLSAIYQPIGNPGYNRDRGPIHVFSARLRVAF